MTNNLPLDFLSRGVVDQRTLISDFALNDISNERDKQLEGIIASSVDLLPFSFLSVGVKRGCAVSRVVVRNSKPGGELEVLGYGTGFLISDVLFMTNNHVLSTPAIASMSSIEFGYELSANGEELTPDGWQLEPDKFFVTSPENELDCTVVAVKKKNNKSAGECYGQINLRASKAKISLNEPVNIIQHPSGGRKEVALQNNTVIGFYDGGYVRYTTDTLPGSSGAPVFNNQWELVALHHKGVYKKDQQGNYVMINGEYAYESNEGIRISSVVDWLSKVHLSKEQSELLRPNLFP